MPARGLNNGAQPVLGFNYGAKKYSRVKKSTYFTAIFGAVFMGVLSALCFAFAPEIIELFRSEKEVIDIGSVGLRIQCAFLMFLPISVVSTMLFQSIGKSVPALVLSCLQSGLVFIPLCLILPRFLGVLGIQLSQPIAYFITAMVSLPITLRFLKHLPKDE